ncbi:phosphofructokinase domain-containing protein, partial [Toxoplasma gondii VAND]
VDLTAIDTEVLLKRLVERELARRKSIGAFRKGQFLCKTHFLAYQGRSAAPTIFDADLGFSYGYTAAVLVDGGCTGYMAQISNLVGQPAEWSVSAVPFTCLVDVQPVKTSTVTPLHHKVAHLRQGHLHQHGRQVWSPAQASPATHATHHYCGPALGETGGNGQPEGD